MFLKRKYEFPLALLLLTLLSENAIQAQMDSSASHHLLVLPVISKSIETSWSFGGLGSLTFHVGKKEMEVRTSNLQVLGLYSLKKQVVAAINGTTYFPGENYILAHQFSFSLFPDKFWGLGKQTPDSAVEPYKFKQFYVYLHGQRRIAPHLFAGIIFEYQRLVKIEYQPGGLFDKENVTGRHGYHVAGLGASITYDTRNNAFSPDKGVFLQGYFNHFMPLLGSDFTYTNYVIDLRKFIRIHKQQVLAMQAFGFLNSGQVPLRSLASFGGASSMRGYYAGRFRDRNQMVFQSEYRMPLFWRLGAVLFGGIGNVAPSIDQLNLVDLKYSYGGGLRIAISKSEKLNLRLDYGIGKGRNASGFYFQLAEAF